MRMKIGFNVASFMNFLSIHHQLIISFIKYQNSYLPCVKNYSWGVAKKENKSDQEKHPGNSMVPALPFCSSHIVPRGFLDCAEGEKVENTKEEEWNKSHHNEVGNEKIIPAIGVAVSQLSSTNLRVFHGLSFISILSNIL